MNPTTLKPIRYSRLQVALMVTMAMHFHSDFARQTGEVSSCVSMIAAGVLPPTSKILESFDLRKDGKGYSWNPK